MKLGHTLASVGLLIGMGTLLIVAWAGRREVGAATASLCTCELERQRSGWCEKCGIGYVADLSIRSKMLYDALDAHGHDIDVAGLRCARCSAAVEADGYCADHRRGFVGGRAYFSRLAYHLARDEREEVQAELEVLALAVRTLERCEVCAAAMVSDGVCPECRLSYRAGRATPLR